MRKSNLADILILIVSVVTFTVCICVGDTIYTKHTTLKSLKAIIECYIAFPLFVTALTTILVTIPIKNHFNK